MLPLGASGGVALITQGLQNPSEVTDAPAGNVARIVEIEDLDRDVALIPVVDQCP